MNSTSKTLRSIRAVYSQLFDAYGPQGWWPIHGVYEKNRMRKFSDHERFEVMLGTILTQNTAWKNVERALDNLHQKSLIDPTKIARRSHRELAKLIRPAGYYNQKAARIKLLARFLMKHSIRKLRTMPLPNLRDELLLLSGVGPETADSIILYALDRPRFVIDAYTKRIFSRFGVCKPTISYDQLQSIIEEAIAANVKTYQEYHALLVALAKKHCKTIPVCSTCPVRAACKTGNSLRHDTSVGRSHIANKNSQRTS